MYLYGKTERPVPLCQNKFLLLVQHAKLVLHGKRKIKFRFLPLKNQVPTIGPPMFNDLIYSPQQFLYFSRDRFTVGQTGNFLVAVPITFPISFAEEAPTSAMIAFKASVSSASSSCFGKNSSSTATCPLSCSYKSSRPCCL